MKVRHFLPVAVVAALAGAPVFAEPVVQSSRPDAPVAVRVDDSSLASQVEAAIANKDIKAKSKEGVVTLKGKVGSLAESDAAVQRASTVPGVIGVNNEIKVK